MLFRSRHRLQYGEIKSSAEGAPCPGQHKDPRRGRRGSLFQGNSQLRLHCRSQSITAVRAIERDCPNTTYLRDQNCRWNFRICWQERPPSNALRAYTSIVCPDGLTARETISLRTSNGCPLDRCPKSVASFSVLLSVFVMSIFIFVIGDRL